MAIYPIVKGQKPSQKNAIPPRGSLGERSTGHSVSQSGDGNLIDFSDEGSTLQKASQKQSQNSASRTGDGPLLDFHTDMKKDLPGSIGRTDSIESDDEFVDAQG